MRKFGTIALVCLMAALAFAGSAAADARHEAYMKAARAFVKEHKFPNGDAILEEDLGMEEFSGNKLAICDVNGDGQPELLIMFEATHMAAKMGYVCGFDEKAKKLTVLLDCPPFCEFYDNGCVKIDVSHNQGLAGRFWPYSVSKYNKKTGEYEYFGSADAWDKEDFPEDFEGNPFPDKVDKTGDGMIYYIDGGNDKSLDGEKPVDTPVYEKWEAKWKGSAKLIEPDWVSADDKGLKALEKK